MNPEEKRGLLSAYLDGELDTKQSVDVELMLEQDADLVAKLEDMLTRQQEETKEMGLALKNALGAEAQAVNFDPMHAAVLREVTLESATARDRVSVEAVDPRPGFWQALRAFVERPTVAFALGLLVAGAWGSWNLPIQPREGTTTQRASSSLSAERTPAQPVARMRAPEAEQSFAKASPSLFLETLSVAKGKVVLDQPDDDPDAPVVLWHFSDSSDMDGAQTPTIDPPRKR
jgi:anti-sigma factor RsiW